MQCLRSCCWRTAGGQWLFKSQQTLELAGYVPWRERASNLANRPNRNFRNKSPLHHPLMVVAEIFLDFKVAPATLTSGKQARNKRYAGQGSLHNNHDSGVTFPALSPLDAGRPPPHPTAGIAVNMCCISLTSKPSSSVFARSIALNCANEFLL